MRTIEGNRRSVRIGLADCVAAGLVLAPMQAAIAQNAPQQAPAANDLRAAFLNPPEDAGPWRSSGFSGGDVDPDRAEQNWETARREGAGGISAGFGAPSFGARLPAEAWAKVNSFATPAYFRAFAAALARAQKLGMPVESTFGSCWPSGGGFAITPELAAVELTLSYQQVPGGAPNPQLVIPAQPKRFGAFLHMFGPPPPGQEVSKDWTDRLAARSRIVAVLATRGTAPDVLPMNRAILSFQDNWGSVAHPGQLDPATTIDLTGKLGPDGKLDWQAPPGNWQVLVFRQVASDMQISCGAGQGPQLAANAFDRRAFDAHAKRVFEDGLDVLSPYIGKTLHGYSVDSSEYTSDIFWTDDFAAQFRQRRGYDLTPYLPFVFQPGWMAHPHQARFSLPMFDAPDLGSRVLSDYRLTVAELMTENFYKPFADLMHKHGLSANIQAHGAPVDTIKVYGLADEPEVEDLHVGTDPYFLRLARAAADIDGRRIVASESLIWDAGGPSITPQMMKRHIDQFLTAGVNRVKFGTFGNRAAPKKGERPSPIAGLGAWLGRDVSTWPFVLDLTRYIGRSQAVLQQGVNVVPVAVFRADPTYVPASATDEPKTEPTPGFVSALPAAGYDYDPISDDGIQRSRVVGRRLVTPGGASFAALVLPATPALRTETSAKLRAFAAAGLPVLFVGSAPNRYSGLQDHAKRDNQVRGDVHAALRSGAKVIGDGRVVDALRSARVEPNVEFLSGAPVAFLEKAIGNKRVLLVRNPTDSAQQVSLRTGAKGGAELWDAWTGKATSQPVTVNGEKRTASFVLQPFQTLMLVFDPALPVLAPATDADISQAMRERPSPVIEVGVKGWELHAVGDGAGGRKIDARLSIEALSDWTTLDNLRDLSGSGTYTTTLTIDPAWLVPGRELRLDLGVLSDYARLSVNGQPVPLPVDGPYTADITRQLKPGANAVTITVFNLPSNAYGASAPGAYGLRPSGLIGPVWLKTTTETGR